MELVRLAYYPFLPEVRDAARELGPDIPSLLTSNMHAGIRKRAMRRLIGALEDRTIPDVEIRNDRDALAEIMSLPVARMLAVLLGDRTLIGRYAQAEGRRLAGVLAGDSDSLEAVAEHLGVQVERTDAGWRIHFSDYLASAPVSEPGWKLVLQPLKSGWLTVDDDKLGQLCRHALAARIQGELDDELKHPVHDEVRVALQSYVDVLGPMLAEARQNWQTGDFGPVQDHLFPPCIRQIFEDMKAGVVITHHARFAIASFLATVGMTAEDIQDYFRAIPNFDPDKSRYQITHIAGEQGVEKYTPPGCATMQTNGVCPLEQRDNLCFKIKHPLSYYRAKIRFQKQDQTKAQTAVEPHGQTEAAGA